MATMLLAITTSLECVDRLEETWLAKGDEMNVHDHGATTSVPAVARTARPSIWNSSSPAST